MEHKHTPGPWTSHGRIPQPGLPHSAVAARTLIARVYSEAFGDEAQEAANARLIAAAPDLLEAAKMVIEWFEAEDDHSKADFNERIEMCRNSEAALRAAIANATGVQP